MHLQVEVIGYAKQPWTSDLTPAGKAGLARGLDFFRTWGIPDQWAFDTPPPAYPGPGVTRAYPSRSGHAYHAGWIGNDHGDPGAITAPWLIAPPVAADPAVLAEQQTYNRALAGRPGWTPIPEDGIPGPLTTAAKEAYMTTLDDLAKQLDRIEERQRDHGRTLAQLPRLVWGYVNPKLASSDVYGLLREVLGLVKDGKPVNPDGSPVVPGAGQ